MADGSGLAVGESLGDGSGVAVGDSLGKGLAGAVGVSLGAGLALGDGSTAMASGIFGIKSSANELATNMAVKDIAMIGTNLFASHFCINKG